MIIPIAIAGLIGLYLLASESGKGMTLRPGDQVMVVLQISPEPPNWAQVVQNPAPFVKSMGDALAANPERTARLVWLSPSPAPGTFTMIIEALKKFQYDPKPAQLGSYTMTPMSVKKLSSEQKLAG